MEKELFNNLRSHRFSKTSSELTVMAKKAEIKTKPTDVSVESFIKSVPGEEKQKDSFQLVEMMKKASGDRPKMWGGSIIGFGDRLYRSERTGREVDWFKIGFSPRKANLTLYLAGDVAKHSEALKKLGKHKLGGGCLYINKLSDVDLKVLEGIIKNTLKSK